MIIKYAPNCHCVEVLPRYWLSSCSALQWAKTFKIPLRLRTWHQRHYLFLFFCNTIKRLWGETLVACLYNKQSLKCFTEITDSVSMMASKCQLVFHTWGSDYIYRFPKHTGWSGWKKKKQYLTLRQAVRWRAKLWLLCKKTKKQSWRSDPALLWTPY